MTEGGEKGVFHEAPIKGKKEVDSRPLCRVMRYQGRFFLRPWCRLAVLHEIIWEGITIGKKHASGRSVQKIEAKEVLFLRKDVFTIKDTSEVRIDVSILHGLETWRTVFGARGPLSSFRLSTLLGHRGEIEVEIVYF